MRYGRVLNGRLADVIDVPSALFADIADAQKKIGVTGFVQVALDNVNGATDNGDGTFSNPQPISPPAPVKRTCTREEIIDLLPGGVMKACRDSTNVNVIKAFYKFLAKGGFTYLEGVILGDGLEALTIITAQQNIDFKAAWPTA